MTKTIDTPKYGEVVVRTAMLDCGKTLEEGIEIKVEGEDLIEIYGKRNIEEMTAEEVEKLIENHL